MSAERVPTASEASARERALHALALAGDGRDEEAVAAADLAASLAPSAGWVHVARCEVLRQAGRGPDALRAADEAVRLAPADARAHRARAAALASVGRLADARTAARDAARLAPDDPAVLRCLGDLALDVDPAEAERHYRRGLRADPHSAAAHAGLARALRRLGRRAEAEEAYDRAAAHDAAVGELRRRAAALFSVILQAAAGTFLAVLVIGRLPDVVAARWPAFQAEAATWAAILAAGGPVALLGWTAMRVRRLARDAPVPPDVREDLRELARMLTVQPG